MPSGRPQTERNLAIIRLWNLKRYSYGEIANKLNIPSRCIVAGVVNRHKNLLAKKLCDLKYYA